MYIYIYREREIDRQTLFSTDDTKKHFLALTMAFLDKFLCIKCVKTQFHLKNQFPPEIA